MRAAKDPQRWSNKFSRRSSICLIRRPRAALRRRRAHSRISGRPRIAGPSRTPSRGWKAALSPAKSRRSCRRRRHSSRPGFGRCSGRPRKRFRRLRACRRSSSARARSIRPACSRYQRRQSSLNLLASLFNALRRYRKRQSRDGALSHSKSTWPMAVSSASSGGQAPVCAADQGSCGEQDV